MDTIAHAITRFAGRLPFVLHLAHGMTHLLIVSDFSIARALVLALAHPLSGAVRALPRPERLRAWRASAGKRASCPC
jgi:hypothetical protein